MFDTAKRWVTGLIDLGLALIALAIVVSVLVTGATGNEAGFFGTGNVVSGITGIVDSLSKAGLVGLIALGIILWLFSGRRPG